MTALKCAFLQFLCFLTRNVLRRALLLAIKQSLCVNPESKNLKATLQYISSYCKYMLTLDDVLMFSDRSKYKMNKLIDDLYEIYSNGEIQFIYPNELFIDDLTKYMAGILDLESVIKESERRLDIYLNE